MATGEIRWHFQYTPGDSNGFSEAGTHQLVPSGEAGSTPAIVHFANNGFFYVLDGTDGAFRQRHPSC